MRAPTAAALRTGRNGDNLWMNFAGSPFAIGQGLFDANLSTGAFFDVFTGVPGTWERLP